MFTRDSLVHENVMPEVQKSGPLDLRQDTLTRDYKGKASRSIAKKTAKLIEKLSAPLSRFLEPGEQVLYIARAQREANLLIQYTMGWYIYYASAAVIVFTDRRLLHLRVKGDKWDDGVRSCAWEEVDAAEVKGWMSRVVRLWRKGGPRYQYWRISRADALNIKKLLPLLLQAHQGVPHRSKFLIPLCPECKHELASPAKPCPGCGLGFKVKKKMYWLSLVPAAAYIYTRNWFLAFIDLIGQSYGYLLLGLGIFSFLGAILGWQDADGKLMRMDEAMAVLGVGLIVFGLDVIITIHHNTYFIEDFIPTGRKTASPQHLAAGGTIG
jgi:hypothetical protein